MPLQMPHGIKRRILIGEKIFSKRKELLRGKLDRNQKKRMLKTNAIGFHAVCITDMGYENTRKAHKNRVFIINPLSGTSIWVKVEFRVKAEFWAKVKFWVKVEFWVKVGFWVKVKSKVKVNVCVWLHLASPDVSVDSADGASSGFIR